jgi:hypothetical protein
LLRYREPVIVNGKTVMRQRAQKLATWDSRQYKDKEIVQPLANLVLAPINAREVRPESTDTLSNFIEHAYLPACELELRPSTVGGYKVLFDLLKPYLGEIELRQTRTN